MGKKFFVLGLASLLILFLGPTINSQVGLNCEGEEDIISAPGTTVTLTLSYSYPYEIKRYRVTSSKGGFVARVADYNPTNYPDHWKVTIYAWDGEPYMVQGVGVPGTGTGYGPYTGQVTAHSNKGGTNMWLLEVRYHTGSDTWGAGMRVELKGPGTITATAITTAP